MLDPAAADQSARRAIAAQAIKCPFQRTTPRQRELLSANFTVNHRDAGDACFLRDSGVQQCTGRGYVINVVLWILAISGETSRVKLSRAVTPLSQPSR